MMRKSTGSPYIRKPDQPEHRIEASRWLLIVEAHANVVIAAYKPSSLWEPMRTSSRISTPVNR